MSSDAFGILDDTSLDPELKVKPYFKVKDKDDKELLEWLNSVTNALIDQSAPRTEQQRENLMLYRGVSIKKWDRFRNREKNQNRMNKIQKFTVNHLYDLTETKVSQMTRIKPSVEILPNNDEWQDRASAKVVHFIVKHLWYINNVDDLTTKMQRQCRIFGESFAFLLWDENIGDLSPQFVQAREAGMDVNNPKMQEIKHVGDVAYELELPWRVLLQRRSQFKDCEYLIRVCIEPVDRLKAKYPDKAKDIKAEEDLKVFDAESLRERTLEQNTLVFKFYHVKNDMVDEGAFIKFTKDVILDKTSLPYNHGKLPIVRLTDLDVPDVLNGVSRYEMVAPIQRMYNNISTLIAKNIYLTAHAKWVMPRGTCKIEQLGNDNTVVQYQGGIPPQLLQVAPNPSEVYAFRDKLVQDMQTIYGSHGISRGEVPKGITAASALQFLNELENERSSSDIAKHGTLVKDLAKMTIAVAGDNYEVDDGRMIRIVGENNKFLIRQFNTAHLHKSYDVRVDNSTGLPETKAAKTQRILDAMQRNPTMVSGERWADLLDMASTEKMTTLITEAVRAADSIVEDLLAGREAAPLETWHDFITHWNAYSKAMQARSFNEEATPQIRARFKDHVYYTELAMLDKMRKNPEFEAKLATLTLFPLLEHKNFIAPRSLEMQMVTVQGQANRGAEITGQIPGTDPVEQANAQRMIKGSK